MRMWRIGPPRRRIERTFYFVDLGRVALAVALIGAAVWIAGHGR